MSAVFRPAKRENVQLLIGLAGASGSGKTYSALRLAHGICGDKPFVVIDTDNGRASHYADRFQFDVGELREPFTPERYEEMIVAADKAGYAVIVIDNMSMEWSGDGGILDMQEAEFKRMDYRDSAKMASWIKPKMAHKGMVTKLLQVKAHVILTFRCEPKVDMVKDEKGKMQVVPKKSLIGLDGWIPITEKNLPYELTASFLMTPDAPGYPKPIKLQEQHKSLFPLDHPITEESGRLVAAWAAGKVHVEPRASGNVVATAGGPEAQTPGGEAQYITPNQVMDIESLCTSNGIAVDRLKKKAGVGALGQIKVEDYARALAWVNAAIAAEGETK